MKTKTLFAVALLSSVLIAAPRVFADVVSPEVSACQGLGAGVPCDGGTCREGTCSKLDYSDGTPPGTITYACVKCVAGAEGGSGGAGPAPSSTAGTSPTGGSSAVQAGSKSSCQFSAGGGSSLGVWLALGGWWVLLRLRRRPERS